MISLPQLDALELKGEALDVVATTSIIGDIVAQIGKDKINLTTLMQAGQDPHSYEPSARDLSIVAKTQLIFVNGWDLEESLLKSIDNVAENAVTVPVSAGIVPLERGEHEEHADHEGHADHEEPTEMDEEHAHSHGAIDPHTWFSLANVKQWVSNIQLSLSSLDPTNHAFYQSNAESYLKQLGELDQYANEQLATLPVENRVLVTNHDVFAYFAQDYKFEVLGAIIPSVSTLAEPSAQDLTKLIETMTDHQLCTLFTETISNDKLAQTVAAELSNCDEVKVISLYTGALGTPGTGADSFIGMFKSNIDSIVTGLRP